MEDICLDQRVAIAQVLYRMAVHDKAQPLRFLTPGYKRQLKARLGMCRAFLRWMRAGTPLSADQTGLLLRYVEENRAIFPPLSAQAREALTAGSGMACPGPLSGEERLLTAAMDRLLGDTARWLARPTALQNGRWITGMLALHNLPRPLWRDGRCGLWAAPATPLDPLDALQTVRGVRMS